jgi:hypothetical protein
MIRCKHTDVKATDAIPVMGGTEALEKSRLLPEEKET